MGRVFVLGSGFSVRAGAPLSRSVLSSLFHRTGCTPHLRELKSYIDRFLFPGRPEWIAETDFEEVLSRLDLIRHYRPYPDIDYTQVSYYEDLLIGEFTKILSPEHLYPGHGSYDIFKTHLKPQDIIVSFNYDLVMESLLASVGIDFSYCLDDRQGMPQNITIPLLKLHGSINLYYCPRCSRVFTFSTGVTGHPVTVEHQTPGKSDTAVTLICRHCSQGDKTVALRHFIIAPTLFKSFTLPALRRLWFIALQALAGASQVFFIGYSLPKADILSHQLLDFARRMAAQHQNIHIINGPRAEPERFHHIYGDKVVNEGVYFEQWVERLI